MPHEMTTAEAAIATLIAHGLDTLYALPGSPASCSGWSTSRP
jgi:hypothetical protein